MGRKRSRRLAFLAPLLVVLTRGDGASSVELHDDHISQEENQPTPYRNTSCVVSSWEQTADAVTFGSTTAGTVGGAASTCQPSAFDIQTPREFSL